MAYRANERRLIMSRKYQPSNGTEGDWFMHNFCFKCKKDQGYQNYLAAGEKGEQPPGCKILMHTMLYNIHDERYPEEWIVHPADGPLCTAFDPVEENEKEVE